MTRYANMDALRRSISPDVIVLDDTRPTLAPAELDAAVVALGSAGALGVEVPNPLAAKFEQLWQTHAGPELVKEYRFHPSRKWRADYAVLGGGAKVLIELEGGIYSNGRHSRAAGFLADCDKYNAATMLGFCVLRLGTGQVDHQHVREIVEWLNGGMRA